MSKISKYWIASREYAELAEAGGVKSVTTSLASAFKQYGWDVTVFIPLYGCTALSNVLDFDIIDGLETEISVGSQVYRVVYAQGFIKGVRVVFIVNTSFTSKMGVYTYTRLEEALNPSLKSGEGHTDSNELSVLFQKAVVEYGLLAHDVPDIFHCQDAHTALIPFLANKSKEAYVLYKNTKFFITIHNAGDVYRNQMESIESASTLLGLEKAEIERNSIAGKPEPFLLSQHFASYTTVSPWYADELLDSKNIFNNSICKEFIERGFTIKGITNGISYNHYDPTNVNISKLPFAFNPLQCDLEGKYACRKVFLESHKIVSTKHDEKKVDRIEQFGSIVEDDAEKPPIYFSFHGRLVHQKGIDVLTEAADIVLRNSMQARFIVIGQGSKELEKINADLAEKYKGRYIYFQGYDRPLSRLCIAVSDFLVLPSFFEPCGLQDFIGQIFGTIPVAHACGGLQKIIHEKTGFLYYKNDSDTLAECILELIDRKNESPDFFTTMIEHSANYVKNEYSWDKIIENEYIPLFLGKM